MIFAHAPAGFLIAFFSKKKWQSKINKKQRIWLYVIATIGGLFPDIDLFYFYFINAAKSHREFFSHSFFLYIAICTIVFLVGYFLKNNFIKISSIIFFMGVSTHLVADSVGSGLLWLYPFSSNMFGLSSFGFYRNGWAGQNYFSLNYTLEGLIYLSLLFVIIRKYIQKKLNRQILYILFSIIASICIFLLLVANQHLYHSNGEMYYDDYDNDGIMNQHDLDIDNDGKLNITDEDIDNDGKDNSLEMYEQVLNQEKIWYDITEGGLIEIPLRMGLITNSDIIRRTYDNVGIFLKTEMIQDYEKNPSEYTVGPSQKQFDRTTKNWQAFLLHNNKLISDTNWIQEYDILFFADDYVALALWSENNELIILEADPIKRILVKTNLTDIIKRKGEIKFLGRLLPKPVDKQY